MTNRARGPSRVAGCCTISADRGVAPELRCNVEMIDAYRTAAIPPVVDPPALFSTGPTAQAPPPTVMHVHVARSSPTATALLTVTSIALGALLAIGRATPAPTIVTLPAATVERAAGAPSAPRGTTLQGGLTRTSVPSSIGSPSPARVPSPPAILMTSGVTTHDPAQLLARARRLADSGVDLRILEVRVPAIVGERARARGNDLGAASMAPSQDRGKTIGLRLSGVRPSSPLAHAGFESNDIVAAVNGYAVDDTRWYDAVARKPGTRSLLVVEVIRNGERVVLAVQWAT